MRKLIITVLLLLVASPKGWSQALIDGIQPSAVNGVTIASGAAFNGITLTAPGGGGIWAKIQTSALGRCGTGTTCTLSGITATTAHSVLVASAYGGTNSHLTGCTGGGGTWVTGSTSSFVAWDPSSASVVAMAYNITGTGGATSITCTFANSQSAPILVVSEWTRSTGVPALDQLAATNLNTSSCTTTCSLSSFSGLTGTDDLLVQTINFGGNVGNPSSPYVWDDQQVTIYALDSIQATAPTLSQDASVLQSLGIAFK